MAPQPPFLLDQLEMHPALTAMMDWIPFPTPKKTVRFLSQPLHSTAASSTPIHCFPTPTSCDRNHEASASSPLTTMLSSTSIHCFPTPVAYDSDSKTSTSHPSNRSSNSLNAGMESEGSGKIPKPAGKAGRPGQEGYNLGGLQSCSQKWRWVCVLDVINTAFLINAFSLFLKLVGLLQMLLRSRHEQTQGYQGTGSVIHTICPWYLTNCVGGQSIPILGKIWRLMGCGWHDALSSQIWKHSPPMESWCHTSGNH